MRKIISITIIALFLAGSSNAQFKKLMDKVKSKTDQRISNKTDEAIDKTLDAIEGKQDKTEKPGPAPTDQPEQTGEPSIKSFSKYDFVPGEVVIYYDNYEGEATAELPTNWNTNGTGEVVTLDKYPGQWMRLHAPFVYLSSNPEEFSENYTAEFDIILQLKNNGWMYPEIKLGLLSTKDEPTTGNNFLTEYKKYAAVISQILPGEFKSSKVRVNSYLENKDYFTSEAKPFPNIEQWYGTPVHVAIQVQKERFRMWINEEKVFDVPKGVPTGYSMNQLIFQVGHTNYKDDQYAVYMSNIKVATGKPDTRHKLVEEGKFSTTGILFDVNSATIRPESSGTLKEIADVMKKFTDIKVKIVGHTDSDGTDEANLELSKKRAEAVKNALINDYGIENSRIESDGKGEKEPVADNKTKEGKAQNRRVEFIKQ